MKHKVFFCAIAAFTLSSCVSLSEMEALQARHDQTAKQYSVTQAELLELKEENAALAR